MRGRFVGYRNIEALREHFSIDRVEADLSPNYNVAPTQNIPVIVRQDGENVLRTFRWGLVPFWAKDPSIGNRLINARGETLAEKPSFRGSYKWLDILWIHSLNTSFLQSRRGPCHVAESSIQIPLVTWWILPGLPDRIIFNIGKAEVNFKGAYKKTPSFLQG